MTQPVESKLLRDALERLASDSETQGRYLQSLGSWPSLDELGLELDDVAQAANSWVSPSLQDRVQRLSIKLAAMSGEQNARLWEPDALDGPEWAEVRALASAALDALNDQSGA